MNRFTVHKRVEPGIEPGLITHFLKRKIRGISNFSAAVCLLKALGRIDISEVMMLAHS
jgi:hypothetical protein